MIRENIPAIDDAVRQAFWRDGMVVVRGALGQEWLDLLTEAAEEVHATVRNGGAGIVYAGGTATDNAWTVNEKIRRLAFDSGLPRIAAEVTSSRETRLFETVTIYKEQGCDSGTPWHQDLLQHGMSGTQACSIWLSLDPVDENTGALRIAAGSHMGPCYTPRFMPSGREQDLIILEAGPVPDPDLDPVKFPRIVSFATQPGDVLLFHPNSLHMTRPNPSKARRRTFSIRYFGDDMRRKASRMEWHPWLKDLPLKDGDPMRSDDRFPLLWPLQ
jgi:ectoine hydroxylase-related dioxygenase (phytanoyl-CoA dioxygenase family)